MFLQLPLFFTLEHLLRIQTRCFAFTCISITILEFKKENKTQFLHKYIFNALGLNARIASFCISDVTYDWIIVFSLNVFWWIIENFKSSCFIPLAMHFCYKNLFLSLFFVNLISFLLHRTKIADKTIFIQDRFYLWIYCM